MTAQSTQQTQTRGSLDLSSLPDRSEREQSAARKLHARLEDEIGRVDLIVTDNRRRMLTTQSHDDRREIRLHHMFLGCGSDVVRAIGRLAVGDESHRDVLQAYVRNNRDAIRFQPSDEELQWEGDHFDLRSILDVVVDFTQDLVDAPSLDLDEVSITWGRNGRGTKSIRFGSFDFDQRLIRIHPALDQEWVPRYFVEFIVYHELLHAVCPPVEPDSEEADRHVHTAEFLEYERRFPRYDEAMEWESEHLQQILDRE
jgi:hypothetical protein